VTIHFPSLEQLAIYDAAERYRAEGVPLVVIAGKEYGSGSSRDWAAKGTLLLGVRAVIAESYERIHRRNLVGMGVLPLQFKAGEGASTFGITGREVLTVVGLSGALQPRQDVTVDMVRADGSRTAFRRDRALGFAGRGQLLPERRNPPHRAAQDAHLRVMLLLSTLWAGSNVYCCRRMFTTIRL
jgi:aconitase A